ncbi:C1 family peptidase [Bdellovibrio svalbardensis]|uniref:Peptidase C1A papain C-terminal domain-containing protein n=1 Tax=Bdellovibrio svalbardensis TaxID=2972972 RepID=A0ABT6DHU2_9BACT|nr:hypothetical protein [Bdellovibrio svalbardensis]MDG0816427.1 hypothetical protein [Bdellovibrio svalbardensis]
MALLPAYRPLVLFILLFSFSGTAFCITESDCAPVRLDQNGGPFQTLPIYNQTDNVGTDTGMCYAISASQLIDAKRMKLGKFDGKLTSPASLALNWVNHFLSPEELANNRQNRETFRKPIKENLIEGKGIASTLYGNFGKLTPAIEASRNKHVCDETWLKKQSIISSENHDKMFSQIFSLIDEQFEAESNIDRVYKKILSINSQANSTGCADSKGNLNQIQDILEAIKKATEHIKPERQAKAFIDRICKDHSVYVDVPEPKELICFQKKCKDEQERSLNDLISSPDFAGVGMHYDPNILFKENGPIGGSHVSVIIGRRYDNEAGRCMVLIRDTYGSDCKAPRLNMKYKNCENGQHWIPIEDVVNSSVSLTYFE